MVAVCRSTIERSGGEHNVVAERDRRGRIESRRAASTRAPDYEERRGDTLHEYLHGFRIRTGFTHGYKPATLRGEEKEGYMMVAVTVAFG